jgi:hypothetical protein
MTVPSSPSRAVGPDEICVIRVASCALQSTDEGRSLRRVYIAYYCAYVALPNTTRIDCSTACRPHDFGGMFTHLCMLVVDRKSSIMQNGADMCFYSHGTFTAPADG